jgi:hypothetical protein
VALFARQYGVASMPQLRDLGLSGSGVRHRVATGRLHRIHRGVYGLTQSSLLPREGRWLAAVLACGPGAVLSHRSAAALLELRPSGSANVDVTAPNRRGRPRPGISAHAGSLHPDEVTTIRGIPCTSLARTAVDLAEIVGRSVERYLEQAEIQHRFDLATLQSQLSRHPTRRGVGVVAAILAELVEPRLTRSELEEGFLALVREAGLPVPEVNARLTLTDGSVIEVDFLFRSARLIVETDGRATHATRWAFEQDRRRDQLLRLSGFTVIRFTYTQVVNRPGEVPRHPRRRTRRPTRRVAPLAAVPRPGCGAGPCPACGRRAGSPRACPRSLSRAWLG